MSSFGTLTLLIALVTATYAGVASVVGVRRGMPKLVQSGRTAAYGVAAVLGLSSVALIYAFVTNDFSIRYVQHTSDVATPLFYKFTSYWGSLEGSILWWVFLLSVFSAIAIYVNRHRHREILPYTVAVLMVICDFFLYIIIFHKNPFDTFLTQVPVTGEGLNPLLQNPYMATHPPSLYTGFVGMTIPFAFAMGALISGHLDDAWLSAVRRWTLISWFFLSMGLTLGMLWAYEELGWGGFWGWDPVENAGFLPWLTGTAFLHSAMIQERRGMMKIWNFTLVIVTFLLTIMGTTMTRTGIVQSVHAFGQDNVLLVIFTSFMVLTIIVSFGFMIARLPELRSRGKLDSWLSREAAFLVNNWILLFSAFFILFATMFPSISEKFTGERINVSIPFFNKWMVPIGLILLFLTGVGPLIAWRKATKSHLKYQFTWPGLAAAVTVGACLVAGLGSSWAAVICFGFCAFVTTTISQEFVRGASIRRKNTGSDMMTSMLGMILRGRRRYGGYIVHMAIVLMFLGFAGQAYQKEEDADMKAGDTRAFGSYTLKLDKIAHEEDRQKEMITAEFTVLKEGKVIDRMRPAKWYYNKRKNEPTTEVAIRRSPAEDLYLTLGNYDLAKGTVSMKLVINPLVDWIWFGFVFLAIGTGIALMPETVLAPLAARVPAGASTATMLMLVLGLLVTAPAPARAAEVGDQKFLEKNLFCMCGMSCRKLIGDCDCSYAPGEKDKIKDLLAQGKNRDEVLKFFMEKYGGQAALAAPLDKGFNRLAWALPYGIGVVGAGALAFGAWRFSKRPPSAPPPEPVVSDPDLEDKLEDELSRVE